MMHLLKAAAAAGASVIAICDRERGAAQRLLERWPPETRRPRIFQDRQRVDVAPYASMHAKCLLVDGDDLLVTSANFTFHGLHGNIEIGIRLSGGPAAEARKIFSHLVESRVLEEVAC
jgi:phosphatidylserine/phosphatidylglycerophosphate/cardiolipin synthase-like enzyme